MHFTLKAGFYYVGLWHANEEYYEETVMSSRWPLNEHITGVSIVCSTVGWGANQRKHQSSPSLAFVRGIHRWLVNSPHIRPVTRTMFPFDDVIMVRWTFTFEDRIYSMISTSLCIFMFQLHELKANRNLHYRILCHFSSCCKYCNSAPPLISTSYTGHNHCHTYHSENLEYNLCHTL